MRFNAVLVYLLTGVLSLGPALHAQQPQTSGAPPQKLVDNTPKATLKVNVLEGEGGKNNISTRTAVAPIIEVKDASDKPVPGAEVVFQLPMAGPGGSFNGWLKTQTVRTDDQGKATVAGYSPNTEAGRFNIKVTATMGSQTGSAVIGQSNIEGTGTGGAAKTVNTAWKKWVALAVGAGALGGIAAAVRGGNGSTPAAAAVPVSISAGSVSVAIPR